MSKVLIAIPTTGMVEIDYVGSILRLSKTNPKADIIHAAGSLVYVARNDFVNKAIDLNYSHLLFIDSDMVFNADALNVLLYHDKDIVSGSIFSRVAPYVPCFYKKLRLGEDTELVAEHVKELQEGLQEVEGVGTAFILIKTQVFKDIIAKYKCYPFQPIKGYGEDLSFSFRARGCGFKIFVDNDLSIGHIGKTVVTKDTYQKQEAQK